MEYRERRGICDVVRRAARRRQRVRHGGALLCAGLLAMLLMPSVRADMVGCRSDPVAMLSNNVTVDLTATISDTATDVQQVAYTLHAPVGTRVVSVAFTSGLLSRKEVLTFVADQPAGVYSSMTKVTTGMHGVAVSTQMSIMPLGRLSLTGSSFGHDRQALWILLIL